MFTGAVDVNIRMLQHLLEGFALDSALETPNQSLWFLLLWGPVAEHRFRISLRLEAGTRPAGVDILPEDAGNSPDVEPLVVQGRRPSAVA